MSTDPGKQAPPDRGAQWAYADVAAHLGVKPVTVRGYASAGQMPPPDGRVGGSPFWWEVTIRVWTRPGQGARTDLRDRRR